MLGYHLEKVINNIFIIKDFVLRYKIKVFIATLFSIGAYWATISNIPHVSSFFISLWKFLLWNPYVFPNIFLLIIAVWIIWITYEVLMQEFSLSIVAGTFSENFKHGLEKWDYSGNWRILQENGSSVLSISGHESEGITKKGFTWSDYEFSFETKIIKRASGWIIRAAERNRFFMLQVFMDDISDPQVKGPMLRPHYREIYERANIYWIPLDQDSMPLNKTELSEIKLLQWFKVKIIVRGEDMNVFINNIHVFKYNLYKTGVTNIPGKTLIVGDYRSGSVGFREASDEEALFRNIKVRPIQ